MNDLTETMISREDKFVGRIVGVHVDQVRLPNGNTAPREVVDHGGGVSVLALDENNNVLTVTQYRYVFGRNMLELPAGKLDPGEDPAEGALRELKEETGYTARHIQKLTQMYPSVGYSQEILHIFLCTDLEAGETDFDENEAIDIEEYDVDVLNDMVMNGQIQDGKSQIAILMVKQLKDAGALPIG
jgi:ADP-ribose pyrophosphatase